ncbi:hypothetical protein chiPu_0007301 [Chiloscyllium punctatum]|uniref:Uncharacterized protein n=1 Tax=Chiloscyllium punctatum TaxID=137246 RepID=A0A401SEM3_CHIPU|nr:hypothetical protein [Chiloscyllium punctatum]
MAGRTWRIARQLVSPEWDSGISVEKAAGGGVRMVTWYRPLHQWRLPAALALRWFGPPSGGHEILRGTFVISDEIGLGELLWNPEPGIPVPGMDGLVSGGFRPDIPAACLVVLQQSSPEAER